MIQQSDKLSIEFQNKVLSCNLLLFDQLNAVIWRYIPILLQKNTLHVQGSSFFDSLKETRLDIERRIFMKALSNQSASNGDVNGYC